MKKIRIGIAGYGIVGAKRQACIEKHKDVEIVAICDRNKSVAKTLGKNIKFYKSYKNLLKEELDCIFVCMPNDIAPKVTIQALNHGLSVFCEKPPALSSNDVEDIREVEKSKKKVLMYGFNHRHHSSIREMKRLIEEDDFGKLLWMRGRYGKSVDKSFYKNWRAQKKYSGGGILIDQGIHMLDLLLYFGVDFDQIHASVSSLFGSLMSKIMFLQH